MARFIAAKGFEVYFEFQYVRPGSGASGAPASSQAGEPQPGERGAGRVDWIAGRGADGGKGDWAGRGRGGSNGQRGSQSGSASWGGSGGRGYSGGMEFTLPPTKYVFVYFLFYCHIT